MPQEFSAWNRSASMDTQLHIKTHAHYAQMAMCDRLGASHPVTRVGYEQLHTRRHSKKKSGSQLHFAHHSELPFQPVTAGIMSCAGERMLINRP